MDEWQQQQHSDEQRLQHDMLSALEASLVRPLTQEWGSGVANDFYKEMRK
jgi:hypothetical protein